MCSNETSNCQDRLGTNIAKVEKQKAFIYRRPWRDDGSEEWNRMWERVQVEPVREQYQWRPLAPGDERYDRPSPHRSHRDSSSKL